ncbi:hypothetical protein LIER_18709 [Lithospermum erythrorhizon]|uniref:HMA domain-containing protein n=1 Tax=Lithospermum erythrorhizon TaxID=34254 RepID=A0AAV3QF02_LITER
MGKDKKKEKKKEVKKIVVVEYKISMHCNACERSVAKIICKMKGVDTFMTDMPNNKVVVTGRINYKKLWKKLRKKTGKKVEMVIKKDEENDQISKGELKEQILPESIVLHQYLGENAIFTMFSDENANACCVM